MNYKLNRLEYYKNHEGDIINVFIAISITDGENSTTQEYFLTQDEIQSVLPETDIAHDTLVDIIKNVSAMGIVKLEKELATKPQPPIIATSQEKEVFIIDDNKVLLKVAAIRLE